MSRKLHYWCCFCCSCNLLPHDCNQQFRGVFPMRADQAFTTTSWQQLNDKHFTFVCSTKYIDFYQAIYSNSIKDTHSTIEMRSFRQSKTYLENDISLLIRHYIYRQGLYLSKEVLWVSVGQRAAKSWSIKLGR